MRKSAHMSKWTSIDRYQVSLKALLINDKRELLALGAIKKSTLVGYNDLPGGRIDTAEFETPFTDILAREIREECGDIDFEVRPAPVAIARHLIPGKNTKEGVDVHVLYVFFEVLYRGGDIKISDEHVDYKWLDLSAAEPEKSFIGGNLEGVKMYLSK